MITHKYKKVNRKRVHFCAICGLPLREGQPTTIHSRWADAGGLKATGGTVPPDKIVHAMCDRREQTTMQVRAAQAARKAGQP